MELVLTRKTFTEQSTVGELSVDGKFECYTLEDKVRKEKIAKVTAIPYGRFRVQITYSPRFKVQMPLLMDVPGFSGIRIHTGNVAEHTDGCILVGTGKTHDRITNSRAAYAALFAKLDAAQQRNENTWITIKTLDPPEDSLLFNGRELRWMQGTQVKQAWPAVSGRAGYQGGQHQSQVGVGPLPEGLWEVRQSEYQRAADRDWLDVVKGALGGGKWPGGESSWGQHRIWLKPAAGTVTHGRSGFSIHGGDEPGSAGCIDLTLSMNSFVHEFRKHGKDMKLKVQYTTDPGG